MPLSECVHLQMRRGEVSSLLVRAWVEADPIFSHEASPILPSTRLLLLLPIQLQYLAPVNSFALGCNAREDILLVLILSSPCSFTLKDHEPLQKKKKTPIPYLHS